MNAQDKELAQLHDDIVDDVKALVDKYMAIVGWDVPENDEENARSKILYIIKDALEELGEEEY